MAVCHKAAIPFQQHNRLLERALAFRPHIAVIMFGTNDSKKDQWNGLCDRLYVPDYVDIIRRFQRLNTTVYIMTPPPVYKPYHFRVDPKTVGALGKLTTHVAHVTGLEPPIDLFTPLGGEARKYGHLFCDGVHPVDAGYEVIADAVHEALIESNLEVRELESESLRLKGLQELEALKRAAMKAGQLLRKRRPKQGHAWTRNAKRLQLHALQLRRATKELQAKLAQAEQSSMAIVKGVQSRPAGELRRSMRR
eukprot:jgi/Tetstr1/435123/TSEL_024091.t1